VLCQLGPKLSGDVGAGSVIALDGKSLRRSFDKMAGQNPLQVVSAWACQQEIVLGQEAVDCKSNEITAVPKLLDLLVLKGAIVTLDAMGCQKEIAQAIVKQKADYVLALKGNQGILSDDVSQFFEQQLRENFRHSSVERHLTLEKGHGRLERRHYYSTSDVAWLKEAHPEWENLKSIGLVVSERTVNGKTSTEKRYYISSLPQDAKLLAKAVRFHWGIENKLHWVLDVVFREDDCRIRKDYAPRNFSIIRQIVLNLLRKAKGKNSVRITRKLAGWDDQHLLQILTPA
jgi:predicted transposase YbfD/YdcC